MPEENKVETVKPILNLRQKIASIRTRVHNIEQRGKNEFHKYEYTKAADMFGIIGTEMANEGIITERRNLVVTRSTIDKGPNKAPETMIEVALDYGLADCDSNEVLWQPAYGEGRDSGDKAFYKAMTGALKYLIQQTFMLAMGDDPEADGDAERGEEPQQRAPKPASTPKPAPAPKKEQGPPISGERLVTLLELCAKAGKTPEATAKHFNVESIEKMDEATAARAEAALEKVIKAKN